MFLRFGAIGSAKIVQASTTLEGLTKFSNSRSMIKRVAKQLEAMEIDPDSRIYLRNRAISALEIHGPNQNWDAFEYPQLGERYSSFIGQNISVDHLAGTSIGCVLDSEFIKTSDFRQEIDLPMLPLKDTLAILNERCSKETLYNHILGFANANKLVKNSDRKQILESVAGFLTLGGWVENIWAIEKAAADEYLYGLSAAILKEEVTDTSMGCFKSGTLIAMRGGFEKDISEIKIGDCVMTHTGAESFVKGIFKRHFDKGIFTLDIRGLGDAVSPTSEHPFYVITKEQISCKKKSVSSLGKTKCYPTFEGVNYEKLACAKVQCAVSDEVDNYTPEFMKAEELQEGDYVAYSFSDAVRPTKLPNTFFRLLGYYLSEGCVNFCKGNPNSVEFTLNKLEKTFLHEIMSLCEGLYGRTPKVYPHKVSPKAIRVVMFSAEMARDMLKYGSKLAKNKHVNSEILYASKEKQLELIRTFIHGDGTTGKYGELYLESTSRTLIQQMMWMLSRARILWSHQYQRYPVDGVRKNTKKDTITWKLRIANHAVKNLGLDMEKYNVYENVKVKAYNFFFKNHLFFPIHKITFDPTWSGDIYNFEVEGDNSYLANNIAVHNCLVNQAICSVCGNIATGELPPEEDFCVHMLPLNKKGHYDPNGFSMKGREIVVGGYVLIPFEINRDFSFFEDSLILPRKLGGKAGGEGADKDAKLLEVFSSKKTAYIEMNTNPSAAVAYNPDKYMMLGDTPEIVTENKNEFNEQKEDFTDEEADKEIESGEFPEGTYITCVHENEKVNAVVIEEIDNGLLVAIEGIAEPVEVGLDGVEVIEYPEEMESEDIQDINDVPDMERHPEKRSAGKRQLVNVK